MVHKRFTYVWLHRHSRSRRQDGGVQIWLLCSTAKYPLTATIHPSGRRGPAGSGSRQRDNNVGGWRAAKCLTRCSKLHLIQRPRLAKWHIVRGASINGSPLPRRGGVPFSANKNTFRDIALRLYPSRITYYTRCVLRRHALVQENRRIWCGGVGEPTRNKKKIIYITCMAHIVEGKWATAATSNRKPFEVER